jgi:type I restriction enzyme M protein
VATSSRRNGREAAPKQSFEATLWAAADKLRGNMDAAEYKHVALGLIFLKYISDRFEERRAQAFAENPPNLAGEFAEDRDWYISESVFWVPEKARWDYIKANATSVEPTIGQLIDEAMVALENENPSLKRAC